MGQAISPHRIFFGRLPSGVVQAKGARFFDKNIQVSMSRLPECYQAFMRYFELPACMLARMSVST